LHKTEIIPELRLRHRRILIAETFRSRLKFSEFLRQASPHYRWDYPHVEYIVERLEDALKRSLEGEQVRMMICIPPQHFKSTIATIHFPAYVLKKYPWFNWIISGFNQLHVNKFSRKARRICEEQEVDLGESQAVSDWETTSGGRYRAVGVQGGVTGTAAHGLIIDDPIKNREEANSEQISNKVFQEFSDSFMTRLQKNNLVIIILTRWSEIDLIGRIMALPESERFGSWDQVILKAECEEGDDDVLGRNPGDILCPESKPWSMLRSYKESNPASWESLYQQRPSAATGQIFLRDTFCYYEKLPQDPPIKVIQSIDCAEKKSITNDYTVITTWLQFKKAFYLIDLARKRVNYPELRELLVYQHAKHCSDLILIEDKSSGTPLIQDLRRSTTLPIIAIEPTGSKEIRADTIQSHFVCQSVFFPLKAHFMEELTKELLMFPNVKHDDQVDSLTQAITYMGRPRNSLIVV